MKKIIIFLFPLFLLANIVSDFQLKEYKKICVFKNISLYKNNPNLLSLVGFACVKSDNLYLLPTISYYLRKTKIGRENAIYFLTIVLEKRLIYSYFFDNYKNIFYFDFPQTNYFLSDIFRGIKNKKLIKYKNFYIIQENNKVYKIYKKGTFLVIDEIINNKLIKRHLFR